MSVKKNANKIGVGATGILNGIKAIKNETAEKNEDIEKSNNNIDEDPKDKEGTISAENEDALDNSIPEATNNQNLISTEGVPTQTPSGEIQYFQKQNEYDQMHGLPEVENEIAHPDIEDFTMKRSYALKPSTYLKLQELKVFDLAKIKLEYASLNYNDIVDMAICQFYNNAKEEIAKKKQHQ